MTKMKSKSVVQPSQDNRETMVKKLEKVSIVQSPCNQVHKSNKSIMSHVGALETLDKLEVSGLAAPLQAKQRLQESSRKALGEEGCQKQ
jgi:hypothetical protein